MLFLGSHAHPVWEDFGALEWVCVVAAGLVTVWVIWRAVQMTVRPGEAAPDHIKRRILEDSPRPGAPVSFDQRGSADQPAEGPPR